MRLWDMSLGAFWLYARVFHKLFMLAVITILPFLLMVGLAIAIVDEGRGGASTQALLLVGAIGFYAGIIYFFAGVTLAVSNCLENKTISMRQLARILNVRMVACLLGAGLLLVIAVGFACIPVFLFTLLASGLPEVIYFAAIAILAFLPAVVFASLIFAQPIAVLERIGPSKALRMSLELTRGLKLRIASALLVFYVTALLVSLAAMRAGSSLFGAEAGTLVAFLIFPAGSVFLVLLYYDAMARQGQVAVPNQPI
jgi:hypothetical protein